MVSLITPKEALDKISKLMQQRRIDMNITQKSLSERSNVSISTLRKFERTGQISLESFLKLAFILNVMEKILDVLKEEKTFSSMDQLLKENNKKPRKRASYAK